MLTSIKQQDQVVLVAVLVVSILLGQEIRPIPRPRKVIMVVLEPLAALIMVLVAVVVILLLVATEHLLLVVMVAQEHQTQLLV
jgi:phosphatidylserine synthase